jgi:hypothetical protein
MQNKIIGAAIGAVVGFFVMSKDEKADSSKIDAKTDLTTEKEKGNN